jgi:pimeloyl-ACP methyl ester carboxylesterase
MTTGILFIHGAGLNASIWDDVIRELDVPTLAIEYQNRQTLTMDGYVRSASDQIKNWNVDGFIIVAHSIGAVVGLKLAKAYASQIKGFVAIGSIIPLSGQSFASTLPVPMKWILPLILRFLGTRPPDASLKSELCNDLSDEQTARIVSTFTPEARALYTTRIRYDLPDVKRVYIKLTNDASVPPELQDQMAKNLQADEVVMMDSGHLPMVGRVREVAAQISHTFSLI